MPLRVERLFFSTGFFRKSSHLPDWRTTANDFKGKPCFILWSCDLGFRKEPFFLLTVWLSNLFF